MNQRDKMYEFMLTKPYVITHELRQFGLDNYIGDPTKRVREMAKETPPRTIRLTKLELAEIQYTGKEAIYKTAHKETQQELFG